MFKKYLSVFFLLFFLLVPRPPVRAAEASAGMVARVRGQATARKAGDEAAKVLKPGDPVTVGHTVTTAADGAVQILLTDDTVIQLLPEAAVFIEQYTYSADDGRRSAVIKVLNGRVRFIPHIIRSPESRFTVLTGQASISASLSDIFVTALPRETEIVNMGRYAIGLKNISDQVVGWVQLRPFQMSAVKEGMPPSQPAIVLPEQRRRILKDAQI